MCKLMHIIKNKKGSQKIQIFLNSDKNIFFPKISEKPFPPYLFNKRSMGHSDHWNNNCHN